MLRHLMIVHDDATAIAIATKDAEVFLDPNELADDGTARLGEMEIWVWRDEMRWLGAITEDTLLIK